MATIRVEIAYALPGEVDCVLVTLPAPATARDAILASGLLERHPELCLDGQAIGIFGKACALQAQVLDGDRVELYRPLAVDPKEVRRQRAARKRR